MSAFTVFHCSGATLSSLAASAIRTGRLAPEFPLSRVQVLRLLREKADKGRLIHRGEDPDGRPVYSLARGSEGDLIQSVLTKGPEALGYRLDEGCVVVGISERLALLGRLRGLLASLNPNLCLGFMAWLVNTNSKGILEAVDKARRMEE